MSKVYNIVTDRILAELEKGVVPWRQPWIGGAQWAPRNLVSNHRYTGINVFLLGMSGYHNPYWLTFKQAQQLGGSVRKGEHSTMVVFFTTINRRDDDDDDAKRRRIPVLRYYRVFNLDQCEDVRIPKDRPMPEAPKVLEPVARIAAADEIVKGYPNPPRRIQHVEHAAWYQPGIDVVNVPPRTAFEHADDYYATLFHELSHSTCHESRLDRPVSGTFASHEYGREELVAEMSAAFLCAEAGIESTLTNSAAYLDSWRRTIKQDVRAVVVAAGAAQRSADYILNRVSVEASSGAA